MRTVLRARWATCALAIPIAISFVVSSAVPAVAGPASGGERPRRSLAACTSFDQADRGDDKVAFTIRNACSVPIDCAVSWRVICAPDARKRRASHPGSVKLAIADGATQSAEASAAVCGADAWEINSVSWSCQVNKD
jgi:hypothetical protein